MSSEPVRTTAPIHVLSMEWRLWCCACLMISEWFLVFLASPVFPAK